MRQNLAIIAFAATAAFVAPAQAASFNLGNLSAVSPVTTTRSFDVLYTGSFTDYYTFSIDTLSSVSGSTVEEDGYINVGWTLKIKDLEVTSMSLQQLNANGTYTALSADSSPESFSFAALNGGNYRLAVSGAVTPTFIYSPDQTSNGLIASYTLTTSSSSASVAAPVPEASDLAMTALGLAGVAFWARRRKA